MCLTVVTVEEGEAPGVCSAWTFETLEVLLSATVVGCLICNVQLTARVIVIIRKQDESKFIKPQAHI